MFRMSQLPQRTFGGPKFVSKVDLETGQMDMCERQIVSFMLEGPNGSSGLFTAIEIQKNGAMQNKKRGLQQGRLEYKTSTGKSPLVIFDPSPQEEGIEPFHML